MSRLTFRHAQIRKLQAAFRGPTTVRDNGLFCDAARRRKNSWGLFVGPWVDDNATEEVSPWVSL